jgi:hypothetical protein
MTIEYAARPNDVSAMYSYCCRRSAYFQRRMVFSAVLSGLCIAMVVPTRIGIAIGLVFALLYPFICIFFAKIRTKEDKRTLSIASSGIQTQIGKKRGDIAWSKIAGVYPTQEYIFLLGRSLNGFCIPNPAFQMPEDREIFLRQCQDNFSQIKPSLYRRLDMAFPVIATVFVSALYLFNLYALPIGLLVMTKRQVQSDPAMWLVPKPMTVTPDNSAVGKDFSYFGFEFNSPWEHLEKEKNFGTIAVLTFSNGRTIGILDERQTKTTHQGLNRVLASEKDRIDEVFGKDVIGSGYSFQENVLRHTPGDLRLFSTRAEMVRDSFFIQFKSMWTTDVKGNLYSFQTEWVRGFQEGSPGRDNMIRIQAFDSQDLEIEFFFGGATAPAASRPSQEDINHILYSLRPVMDITKQTHQ